ncbi:MAG: DUF4423 domain-containing protein, partial [Pseudobdellovibrionaceae bacterium]
KSLAQVFDLQDAEITTALSRLKKLGFIKISGKGIITDATSGQTTNVTQLSTNFVKRNLQKQFLFKAIESIDREPLETRDMTTITCAIDPSKIPEAKELIKQFRRKLANFLTSGGQSTQTYNVTFAMYPITKNYKKEKK